MSPCARRSPCSDDVHCYFPDTDTWTEALTTHGEKPAPTSGACTFSPHKDWLCLYDGERGSAHALHLPSLRWYALECAGAAPQPRVDFAFSIVGRRAFIVGGEDVQSGELLGDVHILEPVKLSPPP